MAYSNGGNSFGDRSRQIILQRNRTDPLGPLTFKQHRLGRGAATGHYYRNTTPLTLTSGLDGYRKFTSRTSILPATVVFGTMPLSEYGSMAGVLSTIAYRFSATPTAVLTEFKYGSALPMENAPAMTLKKTCGENGQWRPSAVRPEQDDYGKNCAGRRLSDHHQPGSVIERHAVADVH